MGLTPLHIKDQLVAEAYASAVDQVAMMWDGRTDPAVNPNTRLRDLSRVELNWIVSCAVSAWIIERCAQAARERVADEVLTTTIEQDPEPRDYGAVAATLPKLADLVEMMGLTDLAIGQWSKKQIIAFIWSAHQVVSDAIVMRDERPNTFDPSEFAGAS